MKANQFLQSIDILWKNQNDIDQAQFITLYGEREGKHLWKEFTKTRCILTFLNYLDHINKPVFLSYLLK